MKPTTQFATGVLVLTLAMIFASVLQAKPQAKSGDFAHLRDIETLYYISQDLDENTAVIVDYKNDCYCSCRDQLWSCTELNCKLQMKTCENPPTEARTRDESRITPPAMPIEKVLPQTSSQNALHTKKITAEKVFAAPKPHSFAYEGLKVNEIGPSYSRRGRF